MSQQPKRRWTTQSNLLRTEEGLQSLGQPHSSRSLLNTCVTALLEANHAPPVLGREGRSILLNRMFPAATNEQLPPLASLVEIQRRNTAERRAVVERRQLQWPTTLQTPTCWTLNTRLHDLGADKGKQLLLAEQGNTNPSERAGNQYNPITKKMMAMKTDAHRNGIELMKKMPTVSTNGVGPNAKKVQGFLYSYGQQEEVRIMCSCHGTFLSPAEFVKHGGGTDVTEPMKHISVSVMISP